MPDRIVVGMTSQDSPYSNALADDVGSRLTQLSQALDAAFGLLPTPVPQPPLAGGPPPPPPMPGSTLRVFLAPEYFFRKRVAACEAAGISTAYSRVEKDRIVAEMQVMSRRLHNLLLIGGSVLWIDDATGSVLVRHSVFAFHAGRLVKTYEKRSDCNELRPFESVPRMAYAFRPGQADGMFAAAGLNFGLETCIDHDLGQLRSDGARLLDVQVVISNTVAVNPHNVVTHGLGYVLHCNAGPFGCRVYQDPCRAGDEITQAHGALACVRVNNNRMACLSIPWPAPPPAPVAGLRVV